MTERCVNKGCLLMYNPDENTDESCCYHPGEPLFHDMKKKWSCCDQYSTDFGQFLLIKGCSSGKHSNVLPEKPKPREIPKSIPPPARSAPLKSKQPRPSPSEPLKIIQVEVASSLSDALKKLSCENPNFALQSPAAVNERVELTIGNECKNSGCKATYTKTDEDSELCLYHPGRAVFHEGMKYWTCCERKTTDFDAFLKQVGCTTGRHNWEVEDALATNLVLNIYKQQKCRFDWFQTPGWVTLTVYARHIRPETVSIQSNQVYLTLRMMFGSDMKQFVKNLHLFGPIDPTASSVKLMSSQAEISLRKAEPITWPYLEYPTSIDSEPSDVNATMDNN